MRKMLLMSVILMLSISITSFAQETKTEQLTNTESAMQVVDKVFDKTTAAVKGIADALKVPAEKVFTNLVKQQLVKAVSWLVIDVIILIFTSIFLIRIWKWAKQGADSSDGFSYFLALILTGIPFIVVFFSLNKVVTGFINPEYGAIKEILSVL